MQNNKAVFSEWEMLTKDSDPDVRWQAIENIPTELSNEPRIEGVLISMLDDEDEVVRASAAEYLVFCKTERTREALLRRLDLETGDLPKGYMISSVGEVGSWKDMQLLLELSAPPHSMWVQANALAGLHRLISRHVTHRLSELAKIAPAEHGRVTSNLMVFLHEYWRGDLADYVNEVAPMLDHGQRDWGKVMGQLRKVMGNPIRCVTRDESGT